MKLRDLLYKWGICDRRRNPGHRRVCEEAQKLEAAIQEVTEILNPKRAGGD